LSHSLTAAAHSSAAAATHSTAAAATHSTAAAATHSTTAAATHSTTAAAAHSSSAAATLSAGAHSNYGITRFGICRSRFMKLSLEILLDRIAYPYLSTFHHLDLGTGKNITCIGAVPACDDRLGVQLNYPLGSLDAGASRRLSILVGLDRAMNYLAPLDIYYGEGRSPPKCGAHLVIQTAFCRRYHYFNHISSIPAATLRETHSSHMPGSSCMGSGYGQPLRRSFARASVNIYLTMRKMYATAELGEYLQLSVTVV
jgi:hypothetical protein